MASMLLELGTTTRWGSETSALRPASSRSQAGALRSLPEFPDAVLSISSFPFDLHHCPFGRVTGTQVGFKNGLSLLTLELTPEAALAPGDETVGGAFLVWEAGVALTVMPRLWEERTGFESFTFWENLLLVPEACFFGFVDLIVY